ncbi:MAG: PAS domain-containing sensor histidine kinase [Alphaproteobacteria bacterium]|jgi:PAS domain S-box-containing protein|nr:hypothetical protein [Rhodospirillaceae bacterium]MDP6403782.1 PAS domain-containing sensor histidine kinase [Alphaproteobacteria bacterium]MDP6620641.1 PAS domain-containing sensor histidine kinase [Alphaproteobacteria bacterium]|tara:strand:+ start:954 stop:2075 length:1122 start_codon:yes stop_codon:yes gene_type:complete
MPHNATDTLAELALDATGLGLALLDGQGRVVFWNRWLDRTSGVTAEAARGRTLVELFPEIAGSRLVGAIDNALDHGLASLLSRIFGRNILPLFENADSRAAGRRIEQSIAIGPLRPEGRERHCLVQVNDVSETVVRETILRQQSRAKSEYLANMSHEIRSPLNAIIGFAELIAGQIFGPIAEPRYVEYAGDIRTSGAHLLEVINDILDLSKIEAGKLELTLAACDPRVPVEAALKLVEQHARTDQVTLETDFAADLPLMRIDERVTRQMTLNLLSNAIKFTPGGRVLVALMLGSEDELLLSVTDDGIGIAADDLPRVLEPFGQSSSGLEMARQGTGLGLPLVSRLIKLHGGRLELESEPGSGTRATLVFPLRT